MSGQDYAELLEEAIRYVKEVYVAQRHHVVCVLTTNTNRYKAAHLDISGGHDVCAEPIALSMLLADMMRALCHWWLLLGTGTSLEIPGSSLRAVIAAKY